MVVTSLYALLTKLVRSISFCVFMERDEVKDYTKEFRVCGSKRAIPRGQDRPILPARVAGQSDHRIRFILPARGASHISLFTSWWPLNRGKTLGKLSSGRLKGGRGRLI